MDKELEIEENSYFWNEELKIIETSKEPDYKKPLHIDLFSGCGGFTCGFEEAGFQTLIANDIHPQSLKTLTHNFNSTYGILGDIKKIDKKFLTKILGRKRISVITAGVPCQGFSLSNRKRNAKDKRNFLFREFLRITEILNPDALILENVSGLLSSDNGYFKETISNEIEKLGFNVFFKILDASDYGVPQKRRRVFFVGVKDKKWLFPYSTNKSHINNAGEAIIGDLPTLDSGEEKSKYLTKPTNKLQKKLRAGQKKLYNHRAPNHPKETVEKIKNTKPGKPIYKKFPQRIRLDVDHPSPTQICGGIRPQFQLGHPTQPRGLTIRERARLQSFKDNFIFFGGLCQERVQTGNAVPPFLSFALANQLFSYLSGKKIEGFNDPKQETIKIL